MIFHLISASVISILFVAAGILAPPAMVDEYGITYEPETIYVGDTVTFQLALPECPTGIYIVKWEFGDGTWIFDKWVNYPTYPPPSAEYVYENVDIYTVEATCWNIRGELVFESSVTITVIPETISATIDIDPDTLNLASKGKWITCYIELPEGYDVRGVDVNTVMLNNQVPAENDTKYGFVRSEESYLMDHDDDGVLEKMVKFDRSAVQDMLETGDEVEVMVAGKLTDGTPFEGSDIIRVIEQRKR